MNDYPVFNPVNRAINIATGSVFSSNGNISGIMPPAGDYFELLDGGDFMLLDDTHLELL